ncbi:MAG: hypothetical protein COW56_11865, partial [Rhodocyclales bacterium CG17_big_fil_post_rev_8_21_14_2_50_68_7]
EAPALPHPRSTASRSNEQLRGQILFALKRCEGSKSATAKMLGMDRVTLWRQMRKLGMTTG